MFYTLSSNKLHFLLRFIESSANAFDLDQSERDKPVFPVHASLLMHHVYSFVVYLAMFPGLRVFFFDIRYCPHIRESYELLQRPVNEITVTVLQLT